jgi:thiamine kinase-like enzyme
MTWRIDQIQFILPIGSGVHHAYGRSLDGYPFSRSRSMLSSTGRSYPGRRLSQNCSIRSARVDFPWSIWAIMQKLRIWSVIAGQKYTRFSP